MFSISLETEDKLKTMLNMQNIGGTKMSIMVNLKMAYHMIDSLTSGLGGNI